MKKCQKYMCVAKLSKNLILICALAWYLIDMVHGHFIFHYKLTVNLAVGYAKKCFKAFNKKCHDF